KQAAVVDAHRLHPALRQLYVARSVRIGFFALAQWIARDAAAVVLNEPRMRRQDRLATRSAAAAAMRVLLENLVFHERYDVAEMFVLVMMCVHIDDQHVVEFAPVGLNSGVMQVAGGPQLF